MNLGKIAWLGTIGPNDSSVMVLKMIALACPSPADNEVLYHISYHIMIVNNRLHFRSPKKVATYYTQILEVKQRWHVFLQRQFVN